MGSCFSRWLGLLVLTHTTCCVFKVHMCTYSLLQSASELASFAVPLYYYVILHDAFISGRHLLLAGIELILSTKIVSLVAHSRSTVWWTKILQSLISCGCETNYRLNCDKRSSYWPQNDLRSSLRASYFPGWRGMRPDPPSSCKLLYTLSMPMQYPHNLFILVANRQNLWW